MYREGQRVRLGEFVEDSNLVEAACNATVVGDEENGVVMVSIDSEFLEEPDDDPLTEVPVDQIERVL